LNHNCNGNRRDTKALKTTCNKNVKFKVIKTKTSCQYVGHFCYSKKPKQGRAKTLGWAAGWT